MVQGPRRGPIVDLGSHQIDYAGVTLLSSWINGLIDCTP